MLGQGEQMRLLLGKDFAHAAVALLWTGPLGGCTVTPGGCLGVQISEVTEAARGEEGVAGETNGALDSALLIAARRRYRPGLEAVVRGQLQQRRVEADRIVHALEHGTF